MDDATAAITCLQHTRNRSVRRTSVFGFANASALTVNQVHSFTHSCPKEVVDGVNTSLPRYTPFKLPDLTSCLKYNALDNSLDMQKFQGESSGLVITPK